MPRPHILARTGHAASIFLKPKWPPPAVDLSLAAVERELATIPRGCALIGGGVPDSGIDGWRGRPPWEHPKQQPI